MRPPEHPSWSAHRGGGREQRGAVVIEFALVALLFLTIVIGIMDFGRWLFTLNAAAEATRVGARLAAVCSKNDPIIKTRMQFFVPGVSTGQISISYAPGSGCDPSWTAGVNTCERVTVQLSGAQFKSFIPFVAGLYAIPPFTTTLPRELMDSAGNPLCS